MKKIILFLTAILSTQLFLAQVDESKNYAYLFDGTIQYGNIVEFRWGFLQAPKILVDNKEIPVYNVKFYKSETGFFGNVGNKNGSGAFAQRERKGKVNLYKLIQTQSTGPTYYGGMGGAGGMGGYYMPGSTTRSVSYYYNKGFDDLKRVTYKDLMVDLVENKTSVLHLSYYKKARNSQNACSLAGLGAVLAGGAYALYTGDLRGMLVGFGGGIGFAIVGAGFGSTKNKHLKAAIDAYNK
jgi:hypothetical protein